jgi:hypothetical protein
MGDIEREAARWPLGLAYSANYPIIEVVLEFSGLGRFFETTVSSEEVGRGKPAPDVYLEAARRLRVESTLCAAVEDSSNDILSAVLDHHQDRVLAPHSAPFRLIASMESQSSSGVSTALAIVNRSRMSVLMRPMLSENSA